MAGGDLTMVVGELLVARATRRSMPSRAVIAACRHKGRKAVSPGFTILELLVVVSIAAILMALGIPSFQNTILSNRLTATANEFVATYNNARLTAIQRNTAVQFCGATSATNGTAVLGTACGTEAGAAFMLNAGGASATKVAERPTVPSGLTFVPGVALRFNGQGFASAAVGGTAPFTGLLLDLSTSQFNVNNRRCIYLATGSVMSVCAASGTGACNTNEPANCQ